jgi:long-chain acyl-CoA synthetase
MVDDPRDFIRETDVSLAFLPWAHSYGQTCELWCAVAHGASMGVGRGVPQILEDLSLVRPTTLFAVPTLYKRIYDGVHNLMEAANPVRKGLMKKALALGRKRSEARAGSGPELGFVEKLQFGALDGIVLDKIRGRFGGRMRHGFVAGAACPKEIIDFMDDIGIPICEGYGLTETSPIISMNSPYNRKPGSVGQTLKGVEVIIVGEDGLPAAPGDEGEICCTGPNVMKGYYNNPEATAEVITLAPDGKSRMFHTGDLGRMSHDGWVRITGRLKEQYKLENGKYVCPTPIEEAIGMSRFVAQVVLAGANRPHNVALIVPDWVSIRAEFGIADAVSDDLLASDERVRSLIEDEIQSNCAGLKKFEIPQDFTFVAPFTAANNMLTPKMSIRRHVVIRTYEDEVALMYGYEKVEDDLEPADGAKHEKVA